MATKLIGGPDLRARIDAVKGIPPAFGQMWADDAAGRMRRTHPPAKRAASQKFSALSDRFGAARRAAVYGAWWWVFVDRGTKAHDIVPRRKKTLKFTVGQQTIFTKKTHHKRIARRPFITKAAQDALSASAFADAVVQSWNSRRLKTRKRFL